MWQPLSAAKTGPRTTNLDARLPTSVETAQDHILSSTKAIGAACCCSREGLLLLLRLPLLWTALSASASSSPSSSAGVVVSPPLQLDIPPYSSWLARVGTAVRIFAHELLRKGVRLGRMVRLILIEQQARSMSECRAGMTPVSGSFARTLVPAW